MGYRIRKRRSSEQTLQEWYASWLTQNGILFCASAGGMRTSLYTAVKMKRAGYKKGFPDIFIYEPKNNHPGMAIELKCGAYPTAEQRKWKEDLEDRGYYAIIMPPGFDYVQAQGFLKQVTKEYLGCELTVN